MSTSDGVLINTGGTIASVVYGWNQSATPPSGLTFTAVADPSTLLAGQPAVAVFIASVQAALDASDTTVLRVGEAVSLGLTTFITPDVVAWTTYRRALRTLLKSQTVATLPTRPAYPVGS